MYEDEVRRALAGDQDAYTRLYKRFLPMAKGKLRKFPRLASEFDELAHEAVSHMLLQLDKFNGRAGFINWMATGVTRYYLQALRDRKWRYNALLLDAISLDQPDDESDRPRIDPVDHRRPLDQLLAHNAATVALCRLPPRYRKVAVWREYYGFSKPDSREMWQVRKLCRTRSRPQSHTFRLPPILI